MRRGALIAIPAVDARVDATVRRSARALGIPLRDGRPLSDADRAGTPSVAVVNETAARRVWPRESALGRRDRSGRRSAQRVAANVSRAHRQERRDYTDAALRAARAHPNERTMPKLLAPATRTGKKLLAGLGVNVSRGPLNRFDVTRDAIAELSRKRFRPNVIIDAGANVGAWTSMAGAIFPDATFYLIEPQPACRPALDRVCRTLRSATVIGRALAGPGTDAVAMIGFGEDSTSEGAWVPMTAVEGLAQGFTVPATNLDALFGTRFSRDDRVFLKLDLEGQEYNALLGAEQLLRSVEVLLTEVRFYDVDESGHQVFDDVAALLRDRGFNVYDFVRLVSRVRDGRLHFGDVLFVRRDSTLVEDVRWK
jgi:FkbM family methyltransferase